MEVKDSKLSTDARNKLSASAFCGPNRSFTAHDKTHVTAGLRLLNRSNFSDSTKAKIKSCLYRKGKSYGIKPTKDELVETQDLLVYRIDDAFSDEEVTAVQDFFKDNPDADLVEIPKEEKKNETPSKELKDMDKDELLEYVAKVQENHDSEKKILEKTIEDLEKSKKELEAAIAGKEDEVNKLLDDNAKVEDRLKKSLVANIVDLQSIGKDIARDEVEKKYNSRQIDSLVDTINDLRLDFKTEIKEVDDPTVKTEEKNLDDNEKETNKGPKLPDGVDSKFSAFYQTRSEEDK